MNGVFHRHMPRAVTCHTVGTVQLHIYSPPTVGKCDKSQSYCQCRANALQRMMRSHDKFRCFAPSAYGRQYSSRNVWQIIHSLKQYESYSLPPCQTHNCRRRWEGSLTTNGSANASHSTAWLRHRNRRILYQK